jgi:ABC-type transport system involved in cytochrome c biogenesis permease subunit
VDDSELMTALGLPTGKKRDRYSYSNIAPARAKLFELAQKYGSDEDRQRTPLESQIVNLAHNIHEFEQLTHYLDFARANYSVQAVAALADIFPGQTQVQMTDVVRQAPAIAAKFMAMRKTQEKDKANPDFDALSKFLHELERDISPVTSMALFPPPDASKKEWMTPADIFEAAFAETDQPANAAKWADMLGGLEKLAADAANPTAFHQQMTAFHGAITSLARDRGEYGTIKLEVVYYRAQLVYYSLIFYILSFIIVAFSWTRMRSRALSIISAASVALPTALLIAAITMRCIIRGRPPVTTLYETILFITAVAVVVSLFMEYVNRQRIALSLGSILGMIGLFLAYKYEVREGADTMPSMLAVLDTNFWLATHVTTISIGYAAGLLAGAVAHVYVFGKLFGLKKNDDPFYKNITRMVYGVLCFGLFFSVVGTVLGGIWANESWGRFWGWDPKENGALMIVLWLLAVLHARLGGIIRDFGINLSAVLCGIIVAFSWFGVNLLGVGLHSYGFTNSTYNALMTFYVVETVVLFLGCIAWLRDSRPTPINPTVSRKTKKARS